MLKTVTIKNFRGFESFELQQLGRINLLVGLNNSGKTSILEAIQLLCSPRNIASLSETMTDRGEFFFSEERGRARELDICHLFYGHEMQLGSTFCISGTKENENTLEELVAEIDVMPPIRYNDEQPSLLNDEEPDEFKRLSFVFRWPHRLKKEGLQLPISPKGGVYIDYVRHSRRDIENLVVRTQFVTSSSLTTEKMAELFNQVVLTPEEELVQEALQTIEPKIERIAVVSTEKYRYSGSRGGFVVRLSDRDQRVPIGSMGDGIWRILGLALATVSARGGFLFVDEIDTGLHFTAMSDMWKLIWKTATRLNVQVFATTHNSDCWTSLATLASQEEAAQEGITIHRIERGKETSVVFTEREIAIAAERGIEVR